MATATQERIKPGDYVMFPHAGEGVYRGPLMRVTRIEDSGMIRTVSHSTGRYRRQTVNADDVQVVSSSFDGHLELPEWALKIRNIGCQYLELRKLNLGDRK